MTLKFSDFCTVSNGGPRKGIQIDEDVLASVGPL